MTQKEEFIEWIREFKRKLIQQGFIEDPASAAKIANENKHLIYARTETDQKN